MKMSKTAAQATLAIAVLARDHSDEFIQARQIAEHLGIQAVSALKILQNLARTGLIASQLGRAGGYKLQQSAESISLLQIVEAVDGPLRSQVRLDAVPDPLLGIVHDLEAHCESLACQARQHLQQVTLADLCHARRVLPLHLATPA